MARQRHFALPIECIFGPAASFSASSLYAPAGITLAETTLKLGHSYVWGTVTVTYNKLTHRRILCYWLCQMRVRYVCSVCSVQAVLGPMPQKLIDVSPKRSSFFIWDSKLRKWILSPPGKVCTHSFVHIPSLRSIMLLCTLLNNQSNIAGTAIERLLLFYMSEVTWLYQPVIRT